MITISFVGAFISCVFLTGVFIGSLYVWNLFLNENTRQKYENRDHPQVIKRRFISVGLSCFLSTFYVYLFWTQEANQTFFEAIGVTTKNIIQVTTIPLFLTMMLFLGPLTLGYLEGFAQPLFQFKDLVWWRNFVIGPLSEEWVFRGCMCPLLRSGGFGFFGTMITSPLLFGLAHLHHIFQHLHKSKVEIRNALIAVAFQLVYTTVFGMYSSFLFLRTGNILAPFIVHAFCNFMGFPDFEAAVESPRHKEIGVAFLSGLILFLFMLLPLTEPSLYGHQFVM